MYVDQVDTLAKIVVCKNFDDYPFPFDKWQIYAEPKLGELSVSGPDTVKIGSEATFDVSLTVRGRSSSRLTRRRSSSRVRVSSR